ncbi:MAG: alpha/beta fold hydrolase [Burkholderiales bacterium]
MPLRLESVILLHGLWLSGWVMTPLRRFIGKQGFRTSLFSYPTVRCSLDDNARRLARFCRTRPGDTLHLVGHSLGGLVALRMLTLEPDPRPGRIVLLGSPLAGSVAARGVMRHPFGRALIGRSLPDWRPESMPSGCEIGMVAGTAGLGIGRVFSTLESPNDGTVAVSETRHPGLSDHCCLPVSHTSMLTSRRVADAVCRFLRDGRFAPTGSPRP